MANFTVPPIMMIVESTSSMQTNDITNKTPEQDDNGGNYGIPDEKKILYQVLNLTLLAMVVYITAALFHYNWLKSDWRSRRRRTNSSNKHETTNRRTTNNNSVTSDSSTSNPSSSGRSKKETARNSRILRFMCFLAAVFTLARVASEQIEILPHREARANCRHYQIAMVLTYAVAVTAIYCVLWYRVRIFLSHPAMRHLGSKLLNWLAFVVLGLILVGSIVNSIMFIATTISVDQYGGCIVVSPENLVSNDGRFAVLTVSTVISQASLLALFIYPLARHSASMQQASAKSTPKKTPNPNESFKSRIHSSSSFMSPTKRSGTWKRRNSTKRRKREIALIKIIKRVMITAAICSLSDILSGLIVRLVKDEPRVVTNLIFDVNIIVNLACVLFSFKDWKLRMFPNCAHSRKPQYSEAGSMRRQVNRGREGPISPASPPVFYSHESSATQGAATSESGVASPSPIVKNFSFNVPTSRGTPKR